MTANASVIKATYETYKHVPSRKVVQIVLEVPAEAQATLFNAIGYPNPAESVWVAVALLRNDVQEPQQPEQIEDHRKPKSLAQIAGIICNEPAFWKYVQVANADEAAEYVRGHCNITSRAALDGNEDAATAFRALKADYGLWLQGIDGRAA